MKGLTPIIKLTCVMEKPRTLAKGRDVNSNVSLFTNKKFAWMGAAFCCLLWGSAYPAIKNGYEIFQIATDDLPGKIVFAGYRFVIAGLLLLAFAFLQGKPIARLSRHQYSQLAVLGVTQTALQYIFFYIGLGSASRRWSAGIRSLGRGAGRQRISSGCAASPDRAAFRRPAVVEPCGDADC